MKAAKIVIAAVAAATIVAAVIVLATKYTDFVMKPYYALKKIYEDKILKKNFVE